MEQGTGTQSNHTPGSFNKSMVLDVKPLRCLVPTFPNETDMSAFPSGLPSFHPFRTPISQNQPLQSSNAIPSPVPISSFREPTPHTPNGDSNSAIPSPVPISSFRAPIPHTPNGGSTSQPRRNQPVIPEEDCCEFQNQSDPSFDDLPMHANGEDSGKGSKRGSSSRPKIRRDPTAAQEPEIDAAVDTFLSSLPFVGPNAFPQADGNKESVRLTVMTYDLLRRRISQIDDSKGARPDLRAGKILMTKGARTNSRKRVGAVPGIEVGDIFFFRFELCLVGLHNQSMGGIDTLTLKTNQEEDALAVSIVSSGSYDDNNEEGDVLIYSGQGGVNGTDQKLERGNLALEKSLQRANEVRVIRGVRDVLYPTGKVYIYDGLYKIRESWVEKGKSGCNVFKYKLFRIPGQPQAFMLWKTIQQWKENAGSRAGLIESDISSGSEALPVCLVNEVDYDRGFPHFTYLQSLKYLRPVSSQQPSMSCACRAGCQIGDLNCTCIQKNGGSLAYTSIGILLSYNSLIYECGPSCLCPPNCRNRLSEGGVKVRLEVFKTKDKGWGLRPWDPIRAGAFICEYAGEVIAKDNGDDYIFDTTRTYESSKFMPGYSNEAPKTPYPLVISAKNCGNVARFMNHSCMPNVYWQPVVRESETELYLHIAFFAVCHIAPLEELTFDYGTVQPGKTERWKKKCLCRSSNCRGHYY